MRYRFYAIVLYATLSAAGCSPAEPQPGDHSQMLCPAPERSEAELEALQVLSEHGPLPSPELLVRLRDFVDQRQHRFWCHDKFRHANIRQTGPIARVVTAQRKTAASPADATAPQDLVTAFGTHARVRVYYSKAMVTWLQGGRRNEIPDGAMMVKEMFPAPTVKPNVDPSQPDGWAVMVRDSQSTRDGWLWYLRYRDKNSAYQMPFQAGQYGGAFCLACHAAADGQGTFAALGNLIEQDVPTFLTLEDPGALTARQRDATTHGRIPLPAGLATEPVDELTTMSAWPLLNCLTGKTMEAFYSCILFSPIELPRTSPSPALVQLFEQVAPNAAALAKIVPAPMPIDGIYDRVPPSHDQTPQFLTADACSGCHDASDLVNGTFPEMSLPASHTDASGQIIQPEFDLLYLQRRGGANPDLLSIAPTSEWNGSLMSVATRDPVFRAQLESEVQRYPDEAAATTRFCLSCHAPMGQRSHPELAGDLANTLKTAHHDAAEPAEFGALARDSVSCAVCHHISAEGLGDESTFNAQFKLGPAEEFYGPFADEVQQDPMHTALGAKPVFGEHIRDSGLCGSCHMVAPPVLDNPDKPFAHEQTTYLEWRMSAYADPHGDDFQSCQDCHMRNTQPLATQTPTRSKIANYEDSTFPFTANRKNSPLTDTVVREGYGRHTLLGLNLFTMSMFQQFPYLLGSQTFGPQRAYMPMVAPRALATYEVQQTAALRTAEVNIERFVRTDEGVTAQISVRNLAGHKFPTGVGFRRAFLEVKMHDKNGDILWCSGCTDAVGMLVDHTGVPLVEELPGNNRWLPDFREITDSTQAQVYETRHTNAKGQLTTSFLELDTEVKDNRIVPKGWATSGFEKFALQPVAASVESEAQVDQVTYRVSAAVASGIQQVTARLFYQALPPYYLLDRMALLAQDQGTEHPETQRLLNFVTHLKIDGETQASKLIRDWKLQIGATRSRMLPDS